MNVAAAEDTEAPRFNARGGAIRGARGEIRVGEGGVDGERGGGRRVGLIVSKGKRLVPVKLGDDGIFGNCMLWEL